MTVETCATGEIVDHDEVGAPARRDETAIQEAEDAGGRNARGAIGGERRRAERDRGADDEIEMAFFRDVERIAVVGAKGDERRMALGDDRRQRMQILGDRALAHQNLHALRKLLQRLGNVGDFMVGADAGGEITVEVEAARATGYVRRSVGPGTPRAWRGTPDRARARRESS